jgi:hypothetical protein
MSETCQFLPDYMAQHPRRQSSSILYVVNFCEFQVNFVLVLTSATWCENFVGTSTIYRLKVLS